MDPESPTLELKKGEVERKGKRLGSMEKAKRNDRGQGTWRRQRGQKHEITGREEERTEGKEGRHYEDTDQSMIMDTQQEERREKKRRGCEMQYPEIETRDTQAGKKQKMDMGTLQEQR